MPLNTPFKTVHEQLGANFAEYDGWSMPADFGDIQAEIESAKTHCTAYDLSCFGRITVAAKSKEVLDKVVTSKSGDVYEGKWVWAKVADNGEVIDTVRIGKSEGRYFVLTSVEKRKQVYDLLSGVSGSEKFAVADLTESTAMMGLYGPNAFSIVRKMLPMDISMLEIGGVEGFDIFMMSLTVIRGSFSNIDGVEIICPIAASSFAAAAIGKFRSTENITAGGMESLKMLISKADLPI